MAAMIAEREITKLMELVVDIHGHLGIRRPVDLELENMQKATNIEHLTEAAEKVDDRNGGDSASKKASIENTASIVSTGETRD